MVAELGAALLLFAIVIGNCTPAGAADRKNIWQRLDQFVAIEKQDSAKGSPPPPNDQPAQLSADTIRATLGMLSIMLKESENPTPLFTEGELTALGSALAQGLSQARPDEDVTFAIIGLHPSLLGLKSPMVTTGRLFFSKGRLNLILGSVHDPVSDRDDRRLKPFIPGSRASVPDVSWRVATATGEQIQTANGRPDWLTLVPADATVPATTEDVTSRKTPAAGTHPSAPTPPATVSRPAPKSVEERLLILKGLHDKGLITEEEYRAKRLEILREL